MTPKDKAKELMNKYTNLTDNCDCLEYMCVCFTLYEYKAKQCVLIAVDEIDKVLQSSSTKEDPYINLLSLEYWQEVKQEINNL